jgi:hypothetical protein
MNMIRQACLLLLFFSLNVAAQEDEAAVPSPTDIEATAVEATDVNATDTQAAERESLEPGVPSAVLAQDVRRRTTGGGAVMDEMDLGRTQITGNQELPTVMYIVPWKKSDPGDLMGKPVNTLLDEVLAPLDREEFIRQVDYYDDLYREVEE